MAAKVRDISGQRFGRLVVIKRVYDHGIKTRNAVWMCQCDCGKQTRVVGSSLTSGISKSCGCLRHELLKSRKLSEEVKKKMSETKSCDFNGLNGYGHTKGHNGGYVLAYVPKHPHAHNDGYVMLHTVLMERQLGRYLTDDEVVHHVNHDRQDNRMENLQLMKKKDHMSMHMKERHAQRGRLPLTV